MSHFYASSSSSTTVSSANSGHRHHHPQNEVKRIVLQRKSKEKPEDTESQAVPDSTTEPPKPLHDFQEGDDVFFQTDDGQNILGTVGQVTPLRCQILFGDGTQQWAVYKRIKKLSCSFDDEPGPSRSTEDSSARVTEWAPSNDKAAKNDLTCVICKKSKKVASKKVASYNSKNPFKCARCTALKAVPVSSSPTYRKVASTAETSNNQQNSSTLSRQVPRRPSTSSGTEVISSNEGKTTQSSRSSLPSNISCRKVQGSIHHAAALVTGQQQQRLSSPSASPPLMNGLDGLSPGMTVKPMKSSYSVQLKTSPIKSSKNNHCFHCGDRTCPYNRVHCNMCERYCHLMCLALTPTPLEGDKFWDVMCSACGTQNGSEKSASRVFSVRRNINSWSDVVHLIINCLKVKNMGQQYFDFESQILPFLDANIDKLHLPRQYKSVSRDERKSKLLTALQDSRLRFTKHKDKLPSPLGGRETTFWALRSDQSKSNPTSPEVNTPVRPFPTTSKSLTISPLNPNNSSIHQQDASRARHGNTTSESNNTSSDSSGLSISPNTSLPLSLKNRTNASPGSSPALSIFPIPNPNYSSSSSGVGSSFNGSNSPGFPRVSSKEVLLKSPITTNIKLSPTTSISTSVAVQNKVQVSGVISTTPKKALETPNNLTKDQTTKKVVANEKDDQCKPDGQRQRLRIRLPVKPQSDKSVEKESTKLNDASDIVKNKQLQLPGKFPPPGTTMQVRPPLAGSSGPRKRVLSSDDEEESDSNQAAKKFHTDAVSALVHPVESKAVSVPSGGRAIKSASNSSERSPVKPSTPPISPLRLTIHRDRQKLLRSSVLKNKIANNKNVKTTAKGKGRGIKIVSPVRKEHFPGYSMPYGLPKNGSSDGTKGEGTSGNAVKSENGRVVKLRRSAAGAPATRGTPPEGDSDDSESTVDELKFFNDNLLNAALYSDLRINCLPQDKPEKCTIAKFLSEEAERTSRLSEEDRDDEIENHPGWGRRDTSIMLDKGTRKRRDLSDEDSYEVVARKIGSDGVIRYLVVWREPTREGEKDFDDEIERLFFQHELSNKSTPSSSSNFLIPNGMIKQEKDIKPPLNFTGLIPGHMEDKINKPASALTPQPQTSVSKPHSSKVAAALSSPGKIAAAFMSTTNKISAVITSSASSTPSSPQKSSVANSSSPMNTILPCIIDLTDSP